MCTCIQSAKARLKVQGDALNKLQWEQEVLQQRFTMVRIIVLKNSS